MTHKSYPAALAAILFVLSSVSASAQTTGTEPTRLSLFSGSSGMAGLSGNKAFSHSTAGSLQSNSANSSGGKNVEMNLFGNFGNNFLNSFKGDNLYLHLTAVASTALLVVGNVDYDVEHYFNSHPEYGRYGRAVFITGEFLPFIAGSSLLLYAGAAHDREVLGASFAVIQASLIELMYNTALKAITGRPGPNWRQNSDMKSLSKTFRFGFLRGGVFWGWPSGHTAATMAVVSALTSYYPNNTWLKVAGFGLVAYTIFAVSSVNRGGMHWFSDAVAAALMSYAIGSTVGKYYRSVYDSQISGTAIPQAMNGIAPWITPMSVGFSFHF